MIHEFAVLSVCLSSKKQSQTETTRWRKRYARRDFFHHHHLLLYNITTWVQLELDTRLRLLSFLKLEVPTVYTLDITSELSMKTNFHHTCITVAHFLSDFPSYSLSLFFLFRRRAARARPLSSSTSTAGRRASSEKKGRTYQPTTTDTKVDGESKYSEQVSAVKEKITRYSLMILHWNLMQFHSNHTCTITISLSRMLICSKIPPILVRNSHNFILILSLHSFSSPLSFYLLLLFFRHLSLVRSFGWRLKAKKENTEMKTERELIASECFLLCFSVLWLLLV